MRPGTSTTAFVGASCSLTAVFAAAGSPIPRYETYRSADGLTTADLAVGTVLYFAGAVTARLVFGRVSNCLGRRPVSLAALALAAAALIELLGRVAAVKGATPAQVALAWLLAQRPRIAPIPGTRRIERLEENNGAVELELTPDDLAEIERAAAAITVQGARYPEALERMTGL